MRVEKIGTEKVIMDNPLHPYFSYFAWPSAARLQDGRIAVVASGPRNDHLCPFGKVVISYSEDGGQTFSPPALVINTPLDDRDPGIMAWGENNVIVTSMNSALKDLHRRGNWSPVWHAYVENCIPEDTDEKYYGNTYVISHDCGKTFGPVKRSPVGTPHGPIALPDGSLLWTGQLRGDEYPADDMTIYVYKMAPDDTFTLVGQIPPVLDDAGVPLDYYEPHTALLPNGTLLCHIRAERGHETEVFTTYQSESTDGGVTWTQPHRIIPILGGATSFVSVHANGLLLSCVERREPPFEIRVMISKDNGKSWIYGEETSVFSRGIWENYESHPHDYYPSNDLGYPTTVELGDGSFYTVFYSRYPEKDSKAKVLGQRWRLVED